MYENKKNGLCTVWYKDSSIMLVEEYENNRLVKGTYYKKNDSLPVSTVNNGSGTVTLYDSDGNFLKSIKYLKGVPQEED